MTGPRRDWDAIVVGLGAIGSAAAYWLSRSLGDRVLGLERFDLDHVNGASADHSRIIRLSYHRPDYVRLARRAYETWAEVEAAAGDRIVTVTGGLDLWPAEPAIPKADYTDSLAAEGVAFEHLDAPEVMRRWPQWRLDDGVTAIFQDQGGLADPFKGNAAHRRLARAHGATLLERAPVTLDPRRRRRRPRGRHARRDRIEPRGSSWPPTPGPTTCWPGSTAGCR